VLKEVIDRILMNNNRQTERTPLLQPTFEDHENEATIQGDDIQVAEVIGQGALEAPQFPDGGKGKIQSHSHHLTPDASPAAQPKPDDTGAFGQDGLLAGVTRKQFRLIFGGILLGYFVSP
jgi:hypothetical protein